MNAFDEMSLQWGPDDPLIAAAVSSDRWLSKKVRRSKCSPMCSAAEQLAGPAGGAGGGLGDTSQMREIIEPSPRRAASHFLLW